MSRLRILCFGDSLTWGWTKFGEDAHPYAGTLAASLKKHFPSASISTDIQGYPGDQVISPPGNYLQRINILYGEAGTPYTWAVILGGTNDLGMGSRWNDIGMALKEVYNIPLQAGTRVLALTIPECGECPDDVDTQRDQVNKLILSSKTTNFDTFDLCSAIPFRSLPEDQRKQIWADNIHFTAAGYDILGSLVAERMYELISETSPS